MQWELSSKFNLYLFSYLLIKYLIFIFRWKSWVRLQGHLVRIEQCQIPPRVQWIRPQKKQAWPRSPRRPQPLQPQLIPLGGVQKQHWQQIFVRFLNLFLPKYLKLWYNTFFLKSNFSIPKALKPYFCWRMVCVIQHRVNKNLRIVMLRNLTIMSYAKV